MKENTRLMPTARSFHLLAKVTPPAAPPAVPTGLQRADWAKLPVETTRQLGTVLKLCQRLVSASGAELSALGDDGWVLLARWESQETPHDDMPDDSPECGRPGGRCVVHLSTSPALALTLDVDHPVKPQLVLLLREALEVALPILQAGDDVRRMEQTRRHVLDAQAELAHELRTPLTAISGFAQLLQRPGNLDEARRRSYAGIAVAESQQATAIIDHLVATLEAEAVALSNASGAGSGEDSGAIVPVSPVPHE